MPDGGHLENLFRTGGTKLQKSVGSGESLLFSQYSLSELLL